MKNQQKPRYERVIISLLLITIAAINVSLAAAQEDPWIANWGVPQGFAIEVDTEGYMLPSAIAFVPNPGDDPKDPLYFVTELSGVIKVVTNDRSIYTFAENFFPNEPNRSINGIMDEFGMAGICLDPETGFVFVTYAFRGGGPKLQNAISRFSTTPGIFSIEPSSESHFRGIFSAYPTDASHQIGGCQVEEGLLYVSVGDGLNQEIPPIAIESLRGKILRLTLDVEPAPGNPYFDENDPEASENYVWVSGFRNPFGIEFVDGRLFIADNGGSIDRFLEVNRGEDYLWDGSDWSIGAVANAVFNPAIGPAQMVYLPPGQTSLPPEYDDHFFIAMTGTRVRGVLQLDFDIENSQVRTPPEAFLRYIGPELQHYDGIVPGLAFGPDGLYFAPMMEAEVETGRVYRIYYDPENAHPYHPEDLNNPEVLLATKNCLSCHSIGGSGGEVAPPLDYSLLIQNLSELLNSSDYREILTQVDGLPEEPYASYAGARQEIRSLEGLEQLRYWIYYHLQEPKFDNPYAQMPNLGISSDQALAITEYLLTPPDEAQSGSGSMSGSSAGLQDVVGADSDNPIVRFIASFIPVVGYRHLPVFFLIGFISGGAGLWLVNYLRARRSG